MTEREALKLALEALKHTHPSALTSFYTIGDRDKAIKAIQEHLAQPEYQSTADKSQLEKIPAKGTLLAQPEQEPVTWRYKIVDVFGRPTWTLKTPKSDTRVLESQPLYSTPPQRKPLTDEEIILIVAECAASHQHTDIHFARAIERAHGIKELV